jgi:hypothetical protein
MDLLTADYTFVDERLARHYGIPNIEGNRFRRVKVTEDYRRGLLGQASILTVTSFATRTSPGLRGKWVLDKLAGRAASLTAGERSSVEGKLGRHRARAAGGASRECDLRGPVTG